MSPRVIAVWTGVLFIFATVTSVLALTLSAPVTDASDIGAAAAASAQGLISSVLLMYAASASIIAIPVVLFPLLRRYSETGALLYFAIRMFEALAYVLAGILTLSLLRIVQTAAEAPAPGLLAAVNALADIAFDAGPTLFFGLGAVVLGWLFWRSRLVPGWLALWKLAGGLLIMVRGTLSMYGPLSVGTEMVLFMPIAVNEMVLAVWLIGLGFNADAVAALQPTGA